MPDAPKRGKEKIVLLVSACGLDRLLTLPTYPLMDAKVRSTAYNEVGGGNAANTASAMALLTHAKFCQTENNMRIKLWTKVVGDDAIGTQLTNCSRQVSIHPRLCFVEVQCTRNYDFVYDCPCQSRGTCKNVYYSYTAGTCGEWTVQDVQSANSMTDIFDNVVHLHSDARHTQASPCCWPRRRNCEEFPCRSMPKKTARQKISTSS
jgi:hypothetical protein